MDTDQGVSPGADLSPISQTSPMSMSPLTPGASPISSPIAGYLGRDPVLLRIHSRRFREWVVLLEFYTFFFLCHCLNHLAALIKFVYNFLPLRKMESLEYLLSFLIFFFNLYINSILFTIFFKSWLVFFSFQFIYWYLLKLWNHLLQLPAVKSWCCLFVPCFTALAHAP